jgi:hypothetical protein
LTKIYATNHDLIPKTKSYNNLFKYFTLERGLLVGFLLAIVGIVLSYFAFKENASIQQTLKTIIPATISVALGIQLMLFSFFFSILGLTDDES